MALTLPLPEVQGSRILLGSGVQEATYLIIPGTSDYVTGGYVLSALNLRCYSTNGVMAAWISGQNAAAGGYIVQPTMVLAQVGTGSISGAAGYSQLLFAIYNSPASAGIAPLTQAASGFNFTGCIWQLTVRGD